VLATRVGPTYRLWEVKFGSYPYPCERGGLPMAAGAPIAWTADEVAAGRISVFRDGTPAELTWADATADPGWCKADWIVADPVRKTLANASNMLDVTWEAPDGSITALDGFIDPYFQEIYLESDSLPVFQKIVHELAADSVDDYVEQLEHEVVKYCTKDPNYGKVARRLYNIFRLTGRYFEAAYLRDLFDEPTTVLYQIAALVMAAVAALDGPAEADMVRSLAAVRANLLAGGGSAGRATDVGLVKDEALRAVNDYFEQRLRAVPTISAYLDDVIAAAAAAG
jgi:hypothetical protein